MFSIYCKSCIISKMRLGIKTRAEGENTQGSCCRSPLSPKAKKIFFWPHLVAKKKKKKLAVRFYRYLRRTGGLLYIAPLSYWLINTFNYRNKRLYDTKQTRCLVVLWVNTNAHDMTFDLVKPRLYGRRRQSTANQIIHTNLDLLRQGKSRNLIMQYLPTVTHYAK